MVEEIHPSPTPLLLLRVEYTPRSIYTGLDNLYTCTYIKDTHNRIEREEGPERERGSCGKEHNRRRAGSTLCGG